MEFVFSRLVMSMYREETADFFTYVISRKQIRLPVENIKGLIVDFFSHSDVAFSRFLLKKVTPQSQIKLHTFK